MQNQNKNPTCQRNYELRLGTCCICKKTAKRLTTSIVVIILLCICLAVTTFALVYSIVSVDNNLFSTGTLQINLNDGKPVISDNEFLFEPGMTVKKNFFVTNESFCEIYYKLYFQNVNGGLADILKVKICDGDKVLFEGTPLKLNRKAVSASEDILTPNEKRDLQIYFYFPQNLGNETQDLYLNFEFAADAVQVKNNINREFD